MMYGFPFGSLNHDRQYGIEMWQKFFNKLVSTGVFMNGIPTSFQVVAKTGMTVTLKVGYANLNGVFVYTDADIDITLDPASGTTRHDLILVKTDSVLRDPSHEVVKGASLVNGQYVLQRDSDAYYICVGDITITPTTTAITQSAINDTRLDTYLCGVVAGVIDHIDTDELYAQIQADMAEFKTAEQAAFTSWFQSIQDIFSANQETNLLNLINARMKIDGTTEMTGNLQHGNYKSTYKTAGGVLIADVEPVADGIKINAYTAGANPKALYIKNDGTMTLNDKKVYTADNLIVGEGPANVETLDEGDIYMEIITE